MLISNVPTDQTTHFLNNWNILRNILTSYDLWIWFIRPMFMLESQYMIKLYLKSLFHCTNKEIPFNTLRKWGALTEVSQSSYWFTVYQVTITEAAMVVLTAIPALWRPRIRKELNTNLDHRRLWLENIKQAGKMAKWLESLPYRPRTWVQFPNSTKELLSDLHVSSLSVSLNIQQSAKGSGVCKGRPRT